VSAPKLSPADWATIVTLYSRGEKTVRDLADMFKVSPQAIHQGLRQRGVQKGSKVSDVAGEVADEAAEARKAKVKDAQKKAEEYSKRFDLIAQHTVKAIVDAHQGGNVSTANPALVALKNGVAILRAARQEHWDIHKVDELLQENEDLAELNVGEYTEDELAAIREANEAAFNESLEDEDFSIPGDEDEEDEPVE